MSTERQGLGASGHKAPSPATEPPASQAPQLGKLVPPYPVERCALSTCEAVLTDAAFLFRDMESNKLVIFCGDCAPHIDLEHGLRFRLVAL